MVDKLVTVSYYTCNCDWRSKYCDENHMAFVTIPMSVLDEYKEKSNDRS